MTHSYSTQTCLWAVCASARWAWEQQHRAAAAGPLVTMTTDLFPGGLLRATQLNPIEWAIKPHAEDRPPLLKRQLWDCNLISWAQRVAVQHTYRKLASDPSRLASGQPGRCIVLPATLQNLFKWVYMAQPGKTNICWRVNQRKNKQTKQTNKKAKQGSYCCITSTD